MQSHNNKKVSQSQTVSLVHIAALQPREMAITPVCCYVSTVHVVGRSVDVGLDDIFAASLL